MKIFAVRIGERYGPEYETYLQSKLPEYDFHWIREPIQDDILMQWNKMAVMNKTDTYQLGDTLVQ